MNRQVPRADIELFTASLAEKRRRLAKIEHQTRGYRDEEGVWQGGLLSFVKYFWHVLEPGTPFTEGWILEAIVEHLEAITFGELTNLLVNVPPGCCKEVNVDEPVLTRRGRIRLGDVIMGDHILTHKGRYRRVEAIHDKGQQPTLLISTWNGRKIKAEVRHPFLTPHGWVEARDLQVGDMLAAVEAFDDLPDLVSPEEARVLGYLVGDGSVDYSPVFHNTDPEMIADFIRCASSLGFGTKIGTIPPSLKAKGMVATRVGLSGSLRWLEKHGLRGKNSYTKRIPPQVLASGRIAIANFIGAYWSCDGTVQVRHKGARGDIHKSECVTVSEDLARDIQHCLLRLGINSRVRKRSAKIESKRQPGGIYYSWGVITTSHEGAVKFRDMPGLCSRKNKPLLQLKPQMFSQGPLHEDEITDIEEIGLSECRCLTVEEDHSFTANDIAVHNSLLTNVFFPAWEWGPMALEHIRYVTFSYSSSNTERDNQRFGDLISSPEYQAMYPKVKLRQNGMTMVSNIAHGWKLASSVGGSVTGKRGNRAINDDLNNVRESESKTVLEETNRWFRESLSSRLNDMKKDAKIVIAQRTAEGDVSGEILSLGLPYCHLAIAMEYVWQADEEGRPYTTQIGWVDPRWRPTPEECEGELAWPERFPEEVVRSLKVELGPYATAAQLQQTPEARGGGILKREWWQPAEEVMSADGQKYPPFSYIVASLDGAFTEKEENDPSALTVWGIFQNELGYNRAMLIHAWSKKLPFSGPRVEVLPGEHESVWRRRAMPHWGLIEWTADTCKRFKADKLLIENKASGISTAQSLQNSHGREGWAIELVEPKGDKVARALAIQPTFSQGMIYAPDRVWATDTVDECAVFPKGRHDDRVDSTTQAIKHLRDNGLIRSDEERRAEELDAVRHKGAPKPPRYPGFRAQRM